ncbi:pyridoxamine 5'-phosphate oxidase family protein [Streptomyces sp. N35]|uniref:pyridoxamine 5'-phosphate oxidase family protein n=1 Tax=Streptomyces sp. N35 TaxID=2795730 RepID=UPI0018F638B2|nr:pyridoxamine 5'-phosphate oxidase family protein [Streptomyces sp. N35]
MYANDGFRELGLRECMRLMATEPVGRVVYTRYALPAVLPVNFGLDADGAVVLRTSATSDLVRAVNGAVVAFETDRIDTARHAGWSVVVTGTATVVRDPGEHERLARIMPVSWMPCPQETFIRVEPEVVTGRELVGGGTMYGVDLSA